MVQNFKKNLILIGMPGCGKTTVSEILNDKLKIPCYDTDKVIEESEGQAINNIFLLGENYFREIEEKVVSKLSLSNGVIISTGGGIIKRYNNIKNLKRNGLIFFIDRPLENIIGDIDVENRPLLKDKKDNIVKLYHERINLYKKYADFSVDNVGSIEEVTENIIKKYKENI